MLKPMPSCVAISARHTSWDAEWLSLHGPRKRSNIRRFTAESFCS